MCHLAAALTKMGDFAGSVELSRVAIGLEPTCWGCKLLGISLELQGKQTEAVMAFRQGVELEPDNADAHDSLGISLHNLQTEEGTQGALLAYRTAVSIAPELQHAQQALGRLLYITGNSAEEYRKSAEALSTAIVLLGSPSSGSLVGLLRDIRDDAQRVAQALEQQQQQ